jgi:hypothetical protein
MTSQAEHPLHTEYQQLRAKGHALMGELNDFHHRAAVYAQLDEDAQGQNPFPLIAAHGAMWASGFLPKAMLAGKVLALQYAYNPRKMLRQYRKLAAFADVLRDINRRVCAEAYAAFHFTKRHGHTPQAAEVIPTTLLAALNKLHAAVAAGATLSADERRALFEAFFLWEQDTIVEPTLEAALAAFDWPIAKRLSMRPKIRFAYFGSGRALQFKNFASKVERIEHGMQAFEWAEQVGYGVVKAALARYPAPALAAQSRCAAVCKARSVCQFSPSV